MLLSCEFRNPTEKRHPSISVARSRTPKTFLPSGDTAYSSWTTPTCRNPRVSIKARTISWCLVSFDAKNGYNLGQSRALDVSQPKGVVEFQDACFGDVFCRSSISGLPESGVRTLPSRTISLALSSFP